MTAKRAHKIAKTFHAICRDPDHPNRHRNAVHQTAHRHKVPERKVHAALLIARRPA